MIRHITLASLAVFIVTAPAIAQNAVPNPLRPAAAERRTQEAPKPEAKANEAKPAETATPAKPPRERSANQRQNDDDMRACGASWREGKEAHTAKGLTWRSYLKDCRAAKKAGRERA